MATAEDSEKYKLRRLEKGEVRVSVWAPESRVPELRRIAEIMCQQADVEAGRPAKALALRIPVFEPPKQKTKWSYLRIAKEETALRLLVKHNGGYWEKGKKLWVLYSELVPKLGLQSRAVGVLS